MNIVFHVGYYAKPWSPYDIDKYGLGGTEQCVVNIAEQLSKSVYNVYVTGEVVSCKRGSVEYVSMHDERYNEVKSLHIDFLIGVSYVHFVKEFEGCNVDRRLFWLHNTTPHFWHKGKELEEQVMDRIDEYILLTDWHARDFDKRYGLEKPCHIIGNGIDLSKIKKAKKKNTMLYTSHPERGLSSVLNKQLNKKLDCELRVSSPMYGLKALEGFKGDFTMLGSLPQQSLYKEMAEAKYWHYPTKYEETFCITALEMLAHGVTPIINEPIAALEETLSGLYVTEKEALNGAVIDRKKALEYVKTKDWKEVANKWFALLGEREPEVSTYIISLEADVSLIEKAKEVYPTDNVYLHQAVNGNNINTYLDYKLFDWYMDSPNKWYNRPLKKGEVGCMLSHLEVLTEAYHEGQDYVLVLEEDFKVVKPLDLSVLPEGYDMYYLGRNACDSTVAIDDNFEEAGYSYNTHAILYRRSAIEKILQGNPQDYIMPWDEYLSATHSDHPRKDLDFIWKDVKAAAFSENIVEQISNSAISTIENSDYVSMGILDTRDWEAWKKKWLSYEALTKEWDLITDEPIADVFTFKLFTDEFCEEAIKLANKKDQWEDDRHEFYPTIDVLLSKIGLDEAYSRVLKEYVYPCAIHLWTLEGPDWGNMYSENFMIKYTEEKQGHLSLHHDFSDISCVLALNEEYEGGGTYFARQKALHKGKRGYISMHPGAITHLHGGRPVHKGQRYIAVSFCRKQK